MPRWRQMFGGPVRMKVPPEFADEQTFLTFLGVGSIELKKIWYFRSRMYYEFDLAKGKDKKRKIQAPDTRLKFLQRQIADKLATMYSPRKPVHGFVLDRSVKSNAEAHLRRRHIVNLDLKDFFPSISENRVRGMLTALNINSRVAEIIARICCVNGALPQGAPSSPILSNMLCFSLDKRLMAFAKDTRCIYTRYADDITFSSHQPPTVLFEGPLPPAGHFSPDQLSTQFANAFSQTGFSLNPDKTHYADRHSRRIVTGVKVNEFLNLDRKYVRNLRATLHSIKTLGINDAQEKFESEHHGKSDLSQYLRGKIAYLSHIKGAADPVVRGIIIRYNACFPDDQIDVLPTEAEMRTRSVWVVDNDTIIEQGSAFFVKGVGLITAEHCIKSAKEVEVYHPSKPANKFTARVLKTDDRRDLAYLEHDIPEQEFFAMDLAPVGCAIRDSVMAIGWPDYAPGDSINERPGTVNSFKTRSLVAQFEVSQTLSQGMSGGPVVNIKGQVVGVIHRGGSKEERNFAIAVKELTDWLAE